jgi:hypothetical protein
MRRMPLRTKSSMSGRQVGRSKLVTGWSQTGDCAKAISATNPASRNANKGFARFALTAQAGLNLRSARISGMIWGYRTM